MCDSDNYYSSSSIDTEESETEPESEDDDSNIIQMIINGDTLEEIKEAAEEVITRGDSLSDIYHIFALRISKSVPVDIFNFRDLNVYISKYSRWENCYYIRYSKYDDQNPKITADLLKHLKDNNVAYETLKHECYTPLICAAKYNRIDLIKLFLEMGVPSEYENKYTYFNSALKVAVECGNVEATTLLIESGADVYIVEPDTGRTLFHIAIEVNNVEIFKILLKYISTDCKLNNGIGLLYYACSEKCNIEIIEPLINVEPINSKYKVKKNGKNKETTLLRTAIKSGDLDVIRLLLKHGAFVYISYLRSVIKNDNLELLKILICDISEEVYQLVLQDCITANNLSLVRLIIEKNTTKYQPNRGALLNAVETNAEEIVRLLLEYIKPDFVILDTAIKNKNNDIVRTLLEHDFKLGGGSLDLAVKSDNEVIVKMLLDKGIKPSPSTSVKDKSIAVQRLINVARLKK